MEASDSKTSFVTSMLSREKRSPISRPIVVFQSWNAGRQCMKTAPSAALSMIFFVTA